MICTFFGHRDTPPEIQAILKETVIALIKEKKVDKFYIGNNGNFDVMARMILEKLKTVYPHIEFYTVLAYMPTQKSEFDYTDYSKTVYFDELNTIPKRLAIYKRNELMIKSSDFVITYVNHSLGGAAIFKELAEKSGKTVINIE